MASASIDLSVLYHGARSKRWALTPVYPSLGDGFARDIDDDDFLASGLDGFNQVQLSSN